MTIKRHLLSGILQVHGGLIVMWVRLFVSQRRLDMVIVAQDLLACVLVRSSGRLSKSPGESSLKMRGELCIISNSGVRRRRMGKHGGVLVLQSIYVRVGV